MSSEEIEEEDAFEPKDEDLEDLWRSVPDRDQVDQDFDWLDWWVNMIAARIKAKGDAFVIIVGEERVGKSTLAYYLARLADATFRHTRMVFSLSGFKEAALESKPGQAVVIDEAVDGMMSDQHFTPEGRAFKAFVTVMGERHLITFFLVPDFWDAPKKARKRAIWMMEVDRRGHYIARMRGPKRQLKRNAFEGFWPVFDQPYDALDDFEDFQLYKRNKKAMVDREAMSQGDRAQLLLRPDQGDVELLSRSLRRVTPVEHRGLLLD